jgi:hypothetical protein
MKLLFASTLGVVQAESVTAPLPKEYLPYGRQS